MSAHTPKSRKKACAHCQTVRDILKPMMAAAGKDGLVAVVGRHTLERIYTNAKRGAK